MTCYNTLPPRHLGEAIRRGSGDYRGPFSVLLVVAHSKYFGQWDDMICAYGEDEAYRWLEEVSGVRMPPRMRIRKTTNQGELL